MKNLICFISCLVLFSCSSKQEGKAKNETIETIELTKQVEENETEAYDANEKIEDFRSELRVEKTDWNEEDTFTDTLELVEYNTDVDYYFAVFRDRKGKEVLIHTNVEINDYYQGRNFTVKWKVGKFYEAGEGDAIYYREQLVSFEVLKASFSFETFLEQFSEAYKNGKQADIKKHIHPLA